MAMKLLTLAAAVCLAAGSQADEAVLASLASDEECTLGDEACALSALQLQGKASNLEEDILLEMGQEDVEDDEADEEEGDVALLNEGVEAQASERKLLNTRSGEASEYYQSQCCLCANGVVSWSARGICSLCHGVVRKTTPKKACQSGSPEFKGSSKCVKSCAKYFPTAHGPGYVTPGYSTGYQPGYTSGGYSPGYSSGYGVPTVPTVPYGHSVSPGFGPTGGCSVMTSGTCSFFGCASSRGPVDCNKKGYCVCKPGYCSNGKSCHPR